MPPKWFIIARAQYRMFTSSAPWIRPYLPFLVGGALAVFVFFIAPAIVDLFTNELVAFFLSQIAVVTIQLMLFMFFFVFMTFPIIYTLRDIKIDQQGVLLSAPLKSSDILLGEFLGELPLYTIMIVVIIGFFTAAFDPLGIDRAQKGMIVLVFVIVLTSALWIGTVIAALLRTKLGGSSHGKDVGKALSMLIVLPVVGLMYATMSGSVFRILAGTGRRDAISIILRWLPSSWGAEIINSMTSHPGSAIGIKTATYFGGLILFLGVIVWIGLKIADRTYNLETSTFTAEKAKPDGIFYRTLRYLGGGRSFGILLASIFKVYGRRFHNLSWIAYVVGLAAFLNIFFVRPDEGSELFPLVLMSSFVFSMLAAVVACDVTIRGKETLLIYKKIPSGTDLLIKTRLIQGWLTVIPIVVAIMVGAASLIPQVTVISILPFAVFSSLMAAANVAFALGLFLLIPAYSERGGEFLLNMMIIVQTMVFLFIGCLIILGEKNSIYAMTVLSWLIGSAFLYLGRRHLSRME